MIIHGWIRTRKHGQQHAIILIILTDVSIFNYYFFLQNKFSHQERQNFYVILQIMNHMLTCEAVNKFFFSDAENPFHCLVPIVNMARCISAEEKFMLFFGSCQYSMDCEGRRRSGICLHYFKLLSSLALQKVLRSPNESVSLLVFFMQEIWVTDISIKLDSDAGWVVSLSFNIQKGCPYLNMLHMSFKCFFT